MKASKATAVIVILIALIIAAITGMGFMEMWELPEITAGPGVTDITMLSDYFDGIKNTAGDTPIYVMEGDEPGGKLLLLGGTHPNEPSSQLASILFIQNVEVEKGTVYVIPYANRSAFTHNDAQEASPRDMHFKTRDGGEITYRFGSRATNPIHQWPDPDVYTHESSGQRLSGSETRNLNRAYPGEPDGNFTERVAYAITTMIREEDIGLTFDLHEASPEYPVINATVSHVKGMDIAAVGVINLQLNGIDMALEPSPENLRGLTHRELGDHTDTIPLLMETANASQGRLRGATNEELVLTGKDKFYVKADDLGMTYVPYDENGWSIEQRVGRHTQGLIEYTKAFNEKYTDEQIIFSNLPTYNELYLESDGSDLGGERLGQFMIE